MRTNVRGTDGRLDTSARLAGGYGPYAAKQDSEGLLRRSVMACLLWEKAAYEDGVSIAENIKRLIPMTPPQVVFDIAVEARNVQKLRHVPLLIASEMSLYDGHKAMVGALLPKIIQRADELAEFLAIYWEVGKHPLAKQVKVGLAAAFHNFDAYQLAKYDRDYAVKLRDVAFLCHVKAGEDTGQPHQIGRNIARLVNRTYYPEYTKSSSYPVKSRYGLGSYAALSPPDTWEVALSAGEDKKAAWERLIKWRKIGALAFLRNLRNMDKAGVDTNVIYYGFETINPRWLLPLNYLAAAKEAPAYQREIERVMLADFMGRPRLPGRTIVIVDVSGSMMRSLSDKSAFNRLDAAAAMAIIAVEMSEHVAIYVTAGNDYSRKHATEKLSPYRGFALYDEIRKSAQRLGGGGIFTRQALEYVAWQEGVSPERILVFSDSQDCDSPLSAIPHPFGRHNYIMDVSSHDRGISYKGLWDAEISGWSEHFLNYIMALEGLEVGNEQNS